MLLIVGSDLWLSVLDTRSLVKTDIHFVEW
jgi:hypothetical protein